MTKFPHFSTLAAVCLLPLSLAAQEASNQNAINAIRTISAEGQGNAEAVTAWREVSKLPAADLPLILQGMTNTSQLAKNYLYMAVKVVAAAGGNKVPTGALEGFLVNISQDPAARKLCYDLLMERDVSVKERILPKLLKDPSPALRREAVARLMVLGKLAKDQKKNDQSVTHYQEALKGAIEEEQVKEIAEELKALGKRWIC